MKKRSLVIAAAAATLFTSGLYAAETSDKTSGQKYNLTHSVSGNTTGGSSGEGNTGGSGSSSGSGGQNSCKSQNKCKSMNSCKSHNKCKS